MLSRLSIVLSGASAAHARHALQHSKPAPYASPEARALKALSDQRVADLRAGRGMGLALPAVL
jgi:hypothetical protein